LSKTEPKPVVLSSAAALKSAVVRILRPLVGLLMEHGLTYPWLSNVLKSVFVEVADKEFRLRDKRQTDSRITLLTGVHRKDIRRLRDPAAGSEQEPPSSVFLGAQLVAVWTSDPRFTDANGHPRALPRRGQDDQAGFDTLATSVNKDIRPRAVLDELLRVGAVQMDDRDYIELKTDAFIPSKGFEEKAYYLGQNVHDHIAAARHNVQDGAPPLLERSVYYDGLSPRSVRELEALAQHEGMRVLQILNRRARELQAGDKHASDAGHRINFGVYFYHARQTGTGGKQE